MKLILTATRAQDIERIMRQAAALEDKGVESVEIVVDYRDEAKAFLTSADLMERFDVGIAASLDIIRSVKEYCGDNLGKGKILPSDLAAWERKSLDMPALLERARA